MTGVRSTAEIRISTGSSSDSQDRSSSNTTSEPPMSPKRQDSSSGSPRCRLRKSRFATSRPRSTGAFLATRSRSFGSRVWRWTRGHKGVGSGSPSSRQSSSWRGPWPETSAVSALSWTPSRKRLPSTSDTDSPPWKWFRGTSGTGRSHFRCFSRSGRFQQHLTNSLRNERCESGAVRLYGAGTVAEGSASMTQSLMARCQYLFARP